MSALSRDPYLSNIADRIPPGTLFVTDEWEPVINAKPDLVLTTTYSGDVADELIDLGIPVYQFSEFTTIEALFQNLEILGELVGEQQKAGEILTARRGELAKVSSTRSPRRIRAIYVSNGNVFADGTVPARLIASAGLADAAAEFGLVGIVKATPTLIAHLGPDVILICEDSEAAEKRTRDKFQAPEYQAIEAVRAGRIYVIPAKHVTASHYIVRAIEDIQAFAGQ